MARARNIKPGFFLNDLLAEIEPLGRLLFAGLWTIADREGRLEDRPKKIKAAVLPYDDCDIDHLLDELEKRDFIVRYEVNKEKYIQITKWEKHQNPHYKEVKSEIPPCLNNKSSKKQTNKKVTVKAKEEHFNVDSTLNQHQAKLGSSSHADSLNLIPDSLNPIKDMSAEAESISSQDTSSSNHKKEIQEIMDFYNQQFSECWSSPLKLTKERYKHIRSRLKNFNIDDLKKAILNIRASPFHCGENDKGKVYATPEFLFRNDTQVDKWIKEINMKGGTIQPDGKSKYDWLIRK